MKKKLTAWIATALVMGSTLTTAAAADTDSVAREIAADAQTAPETAAPARSAARTATRPAAPAAVDLTPSADRGSQSAPGQPAYIERSDIFETAELRRLITPDEVAASVLYLCSPSSQSVTGTPWAPMGPSSGASSLFTRSGLAPGLSILLMATTMGTSAALA